MRKGILALALCLLLSGCGPAAEERRPEEAGAPVRVIGPEEADWRADYVTFLENLCEEERAVLNIDRPDYDPNDYPAQVGNLSKEYFLYDLDWDGVPELVLRSNHYHSDIRVLTVRNGAAVEAGRLDGRYMEFYTSPDRPGIIVRETPKGPVFVYRVTLENGELRQGEDLYATDMSVRCVDETFCMEDVAPGAAYIRGCRTMAEWPEHTPLTLPVYDYGRESAATDTAGTRGGLRWRSICGRAASWTTRKSRCSPGGGPGWIWTGTDSGSVCCMWSTARETTSKAAIL